MRCQKALPPCRKPSIWQALSHVVMLVDLRCSVSICSTRREVNSRLAEVSRSLWLRHDFLILPWANLQAPEVLT